MLLPAQCRVNGFQDFFPFSSHHVFAFCCVMCKVPKARAHSKPCTASQNKPCYSIDPSPHPAPITYHRPSLIYVPMSLPFLHHPKHVTGSLVVMTKLTFHSLVCMYMSQPQIVRTFLMRVSEQLTICRNPPHQVAFVAATAQNSLPLLLRNRLL